VYFQIQSITVQTFKLSFACDMTPTFGFQYGVITGSLNKNALAIVEGTSKWHK
jgi:hypothetical protein